MMKFQLISVLIIFGIAAVFYFSWLPNPSLTKSGLLPEWVSRWSDQNANMNLRTAVPLFLLGILCSIWLLTAKKNIVWWLAFCVALGLTVLLAELGQLFLPYRHFDWGDVGWGFVGALAGMLPLGMIRMTTRIFSHS